MSIKNGLPQANLKMVWIDGILCKTFVRFQPGNRFNHFQWLIDVYAEPVNKYSVLYIEQKKRCKGHWVIDVLDNPQISEDIFSQAVLKLPLICCEPGKRSGGE